MTSGSVQTKGIAETFDDLAHDRCCKYKSNGLTASSQVLLDFISNKGLVGKTVLEIGCGTGLINLVERLRKTGFRWYLHPLRSIDELLAESGFQQENKAKSRFWLVFLYKRTRPDAPRRE